MNLPLASRLFKLLIFLWDLKHLTAVVMKISIFSNIMSCSLLKVNQQTFQRNTSPQSSGLKNNSSKKPTSRNKQAELCLFFNPEVGKKNGKAIPVAGRGNPYGYEISRIPYFLDNWLTDGSKVVSLTCWLPFTPRKIPGTHFC
jgi:hypothetical protein